MATRTGLTLLRNARQGDTAAQLALGRVYLVGEHGLGRNLVTAYYWLEQAARAGSAEAWQLIGREVPLHELKDPVAALPWYQRAAAQGIAPAQRSVALWLLAQTPEAARDAMPLLEQAADQGDLEAQVQLGKLHLAGVHVPKDRVLARARFEQAAAQGSLESHRELIAIFAQAGDAAGVERYARPLALRGDAQASYALGRALLGDALEDAAD